MCCLLSPLTANSGGSFSGEQDSMDDVGLMRSAVRGEERKDVSVHMRRKANVAGYCTGTIAAHTHTRTRTRTRTTLTFRLPEVVVEDAICFQLAPNVVAGHTLQVQVCVGGEEGGA